MLLFLARTALNASVANEKAFVNNRTVFAETPFHTHLNCQFPPNETLIQQFQYLTLTEEMMIGFNSLVPHPPPTSKVLHLRALSKVSFVLVLCETKERKES